jgi:chromosomal replication initiator protein
MPAPDRHGGKDFTRELIAALEQRMGEERFLLWFARGVRVDAGNDAVVFWVDSRFAFDRMRSRHQPELQAAVEEVYGRSVPIDVRLNESSEDHESVRRDHRSKETEPRTGAGAESSEARRRSIPNSAQLRRRSSDRREGSPALVRITSVDGAVNDPSSQVAADALRFGPAERNLDGAESERSARRGNGGRLNASLDLLCEGSGNRLAMASARMVLDSPGTVNPLFLWGPHGVGKSHVLQALQEGLRTKYGMRRVILLSAEEFTNDFMAALGGSGLPSFRRRYREVDALLIDDVQFFSGKKATLREVLFTVDTLLRGRKPLAFAADRPPLELEGWGGELIGRLSAGVVAAIQPLDDEMRWNVLKQYSERAGLQLREGVLEHLAQQLSGDARALIGAVNRLRLIQQVQGTPLTWDLVRQELGDLLEAGRVAVGLSDIQKAVCDAFGLPTGALQSREQRRAVSEPRMLAMYLARRLTQSAFSEIGRYFGKRSHSTVIAAEKCVQRWLEDGSNVEGPDRRMPVRQAIATIEGRLRTG